VHSCHSTEIGTARAAVLSGDSVGVKASAMPDTAAIPSCGNTASQICGRAVPVERWRGDGLNSSGSRSPTRSVHSLRRCPSVRLYYE
jgi:hypothetical protein